MNIMGLARTGENITRDFFRIDFAKIPSAICRREERCPQTCPQDGRAGLLHSSSIRRRVGCATIQLHQVGLRALDAMTPGAFGAAVAQVRKLLSRAEAPVLMAGFGGWAPSVCSVFSDKVDYRETQTVATLQLLARTSQCAVERRAFLVGA